MISRVSYSGNRVGLNYMRWRGRGFLQVAVAYQHALSCLAGVWKNGNHYRWIVILGKEGSEGSGTRMSPAVLEVSDSDTDGLVD